MVQDLYDSELLLYHVRLRDPIPLLAYPKDCKDVILKSISDFGYELPTQVLFKYLYYTGVLALREVYPQLIEQFEAYTQKWVIPKYETRWQRFRRRKIISKPFKFTVSEKFRNLETCFKALTFIQQNPKWGKAVVASWCPNYLGHEQTIGAVITHVIDNTFISIEERYLMPDCPAEWRSYFHNTSPFGSLWDLPWRASGFNDVMIKKSFTSESELRKLDTYDSVYDYLLGLLPEDAECQWNSMDYSLRCSLANHAIYIEHEEFLSLFDELDLNL
jgi:hypothetical protein